jgi:hypothetical protein
MDISGLGSVTFGPADSVGARRCIDVSATQDGVLEAVAEELSLTLGSSDERVVFNPNATTLTITSES